MRVKTLIFAFILLIFLGLLIFVGLKSFNVNPPLKVLSESFSHGLPLDRLVLPPGFEAHVFADNVENARSMCFGKDNSVLFVGTRSLGNVYALIDEDRDGRAEEVLTIYSGGNMPNGVAYREGHLYVAEVNRILVFENIEQNLRNPSEPKVVFDKYPNDGHHGWKYIAFGPDDLLYVPVGAPCNICASEDSIYASLTRLDLNSGKMEIVHRGIRNTVGFDWHPKNKKLWFTDNGRDMMGDNLPQCELNKADADFLHFGYPYCHEGDVPDPEFGNLHSCDQFEGPAHKMGPHTAPLGMTFYSSTSFPSDYHHNIFIARHGSWNRSEKIGYDVYRVALDSLGEVTLGEVFVSGWLSEDKKEVWGRPVDVIEADDGSILISDDFADAVYRITFSGQ